jgi:DNA-binding transcriptional ArsR family regulator
MSLGDKDEQAALRALAHPVRLQMMSLLTAAPMTAAEVARELGLTHANASYHLRNLLAGGLIVADGEEKIRGGVAKRYRYDPAHEDERRRAGGPRSDEQNRLEIAAIANELLRRISDAHFTERPMLLVDAELWVDPDKWASIRTRVAEAMVELHAAGRPPGTPGTVRTSSTAALFEIGS